MWHIAHNGDRIVRCRFSMLTNRNVAALDQDFVINTGVHSLSLTLTKDFGYLASQHQYCNTFGSPLLLLSNFRYTRSSSTSNASQLLQSFCVSSYSQTSISSFVGLSVYVRRNCTIRLTQFWVRSLLFDEALPHRGGFYSFRRRVFINSVNRIHAQWTFDVCFICLRSSAQAVGITVSMSTSAFLVPTSCAILSSLFRFSPAFFAFRLNFK